MDIVKDILLAQDKQKNIVNNSFTHNLGNIEKGGLIASIGEIRKWKGGEYKKVSKDKWEKIINEFDKYIKINNYAGQIFEGTKHINRLSREEEQGRIAGGKINVEATLLLGTSKVSDGKAYERQEQLNLLKEFAQNNDCWINNYKDKFGEDNKIGEESESEVFYDKSGYVIKVNNFSQHEDILEMFDRISFQNLLFPDTGYEVLGFTEREGQVNIILKQPFIKMQEDLSSNIVRPSKDELSEDMAKMGFEDKRGNMFVSPNYIVEDLHLGNVCLSKYGTIMYIDPVIRANTEEEYGGHRKFGKIILD